MPGSLPLDGKVAYTSLSQKGLLKVGRPDHLDLWPGASHRSCVCETLKEEHMGAGRKTYTYDVDVRGLATENTSNFEGQQRHLQKNLGGCIFGGLSSG